LLPSTMALAIIAALLIAISVTRFHKSIE